MTLGETFKRTFSASIDSKINLDLSSGRRNSWKREMMVLLIYTPMGIGLEILNTMILFTNFLHHKIPFFCERANTRTFDYRRIFRERQTFKLAFVQ